MDTQLEKQRQALTDRLKDELFAQHDSQRELDFLKLQMKERAARIKELSNELDAPYRASHD